MSWNPSASHKLAATLAHVRSAMEVSPACPICRARSGCRASSSIAAATAPGAGSQTKPLCPFFTIRAGSPLSVQVMTGLPLQETPPARVTSPRILILRGKDDSQSARIQFGERFIRHATDEPDATVGSSKRAELLFILPGTRDDQFAARIDCCAWPLLQAAGVSSQCKRPALAGRSNPDAPPCNPASVLGCRPHRCA